MNMETKQMNENRRSFLKKVGYTAPVILALGALATPTNGHASNSAIATPVNVDVTVNGTNQVVTVPKGSVVDLW
jgi:hypothetical protein